MPQIAETFEDSEQRYSELFKKLDKGGDGRIDIKDLTSELKELGVCESYAAVSFHRKFWSEQEQRKKNPTYMPIKFTQ